VWAMQIICCVVIVSPPPPPGRLPHILLVCLYLTNKTDLLRPKKESDVKVTQQFKAISLSSSVFLNARTEDHFHPSRADSFIPLFLP
jgi:hypothetical protein